MDTDQRVGGVLGVDLGGRGHVPDAKDTALTGGEDVRGAAAGDVEPFQRSFQGQRHHALQALERRHYPQRRVALEVPQNQHLVSAAPVRYHRTNPKTR